MRVAVLADSHLQRHALREALTGLGYQLAVNMDPARLEVATLDQHAADVWLVSLLQVDAHLQALLEHLYEQDVPVLVGEGVTPHTGSEEYPRWRRSLDSKLRTLVPRPDEPLLQQEASVVEMQAVGGPATQVWLLAASLGGPVAVKEFLDCLPGNLPIGFLYAQHIDQGFEKSLPKAVGRHSQWQVRLARHNDFVGTGEVVVVPVDQELTFTASGRMQCRGRPWQGSYAPSIEQMMLNLAVGFGPRCGVIVFSGMGEDGSAACLDATGMGMQIWAQCSQSSTCASMPDSIRNTGYSSYSGSPRELAQAMAQHAGRAAGTDL